MMERGLTQGLWEHRRGAAGAPPPCGELTGDVPAPSPGWRTLRERASGRALGEDRTGGVGTTSDQRGRPRCFCRSSQMAHIFWTSVC